LNLGGFAVAAVEGCFVEEVDVALRCGEEELVNTVADDVGEVLEGKWLKFQASDVGMMMGFLQERWCQYMQTQDDLSFTYF